MLYFVIKFIKLFFGQPSQACKHFSKLKKEWQINRVGQRVNGLACTAPQYFDTCFVKHQLPFYKCDVEHCIEKQLGRIVVHMDRAKHTIDLAIYVLSSMTIGYALERAAKRGVRVRVLFDTEHVRLKIQLDPRAEFRRAVNINNMGAMMHNKFCIIDGYGAQRALNATKGKALAVCMSGSMNLVFMPRGCDDLCITSAPKIARGLEKEFERMWKKF